MAKTMPKRIDNVIEEGFSMVKGNYLEFLSLYLIFVALFAIIFVAALAIFLAVAVGGGWSGTNAAGSAMLFIILLVLGVIFLLEPLWIGSYYAIAVQNMSGRRVSAWDAISMAKDRYVKLLWTMALETLVFIAVDAVIFSPLAVPSIGFINAYAASGSMSNAVGSSLLPLIGLAIVLIIVYLLASAALAPLLYEAVPLVMLEGVSGVGAVKESIEIGRGNFWNIIWLVVLFGIIYGAVVFAQNLVAFAMQVLGHLAGSILALIISFLVGAFLTAWFYVLPIIFYNDFLRKGLRQGR